MGEGGLNMKVMPAPNRKGFLSACAILFLGITWVVTASISFDSIELEDTSIPDVLVSLARQAGFNVIIDPRVPGSGFEPGKSAPPLKKVKIHLPEVTPQAAILAVLKEFQLTMVTNPATRIARIVPVGVVVKPVAAIRVGTDTNSLPMLVAESVPLTQALGYFAQAAGLKVSFAPEVAGLDGRGKVSYRWEGVTARQALAALLDNYGLEMQEDAPVLTVKIMLARDRKD
jgi:type II secretory pathway component GspD/PulD (secretin)